MFVKDNTDYICLSIKRFLARTLDLVIYDFIFGIILYIVLDSFPIQDQFLKYMVGFIPYILMIVIEPLLLHLFGTTCGKFLMGLYVYTVNDNKLTYQEAFERVKKVFIFGYGLHLPIIQLVLLIRSYWKAKDNISLAWDSEGKVVAKKRLMFVKCLSIPCIFLIVLTSAWVESSAILPNNRGNISPEELEENYRSYLSCYGVRENAPELSIKEENGVITEVSFEYRTKDRDEIPASYDIAVSALMAYAGAQKEITGSDVFDADMLDLCNYGNYIYYDSFEFEIENITVQADVEACGYESVPGAAIYPMGDETISYELTFTMTHK